LVSTPTFFDIAILKRTLAEANQYSPNKKIKFDNFSDHVFWGHKPRKSIFIRKRRSGCHKILLPNNEQFANCQRIVSELKANCQRIVSAKKPVFPASRFVPKAFVRKR
jgi:hypothetical protein